jgi:hypothetical protein
MSAVSTTRQALHSYDSSSELVSIQTQEQDTQDTPTRIVLPPPVPLATPEELVHLQRQLKKWVDRMNRRFTDTDLWLLEHPPLCDITEARLVQHLTWIRTSYTLLKEAIVAERKQLNIPRMLWFKHHVVWVESQLRAWYKQLFL